MNGMTLTVLQTQHSSVKQFASTNSLHDLTSQPLGHGRERISTSGTLHCSNQLTVIHIHISKVLVVFTQHTLERAMQKRGNCLCSFTAVQVPSNTLLRLYLDVFVWTAMSEPVLIMCSASCTCVSVQTVTLWDHHLWCRVHESMAS